MLIGYLIPVACCLVASLVIWIVGIGCFPNSDFVHQAAGLLGLGGAPDWVIIAMFVGLQGTTGRSRGSAQRSAKRSAGADSLACVRDFGESSHMTSDSAQQPRPVDNLSALTRKSVSMRHGGTNRS